MIHTWVSLIPVYEKILAHVKPEHENDDEIVACRKDLEEVKRSLRDDMREHLDILEDCIVNDVTEPPWCAFSDKGQILAVMPAGRPGDVFKFEEPPKEADAHFLLMAQPHHIHAMIQRIRDLETLAKVEERWTKAEAPDKMAKADESKDD